MLRTIHGTNCLYGIIAAGIVTIGVASVAQAQATREAHGDGSLSLRQGQAVAVNNSGGRFDLEEHTESRSAAYDETYHLLNRAPRERLRPVAPEPHLFTTDPGWFQLEVDPLNFTYNRDSDQRTRAFEVPVLFKAGVLEHVDLQIGMEAFIWEKVRDRDTGDRDTETGHGDLALASKINLWGNDGGDSAASVYPLIVLSTGSEAFGTDGLEGGVMLPTAWALEHFDLEFTPHAAAVRGGGANRYEGEFGQLTVLSRDLVGDFVGFVEFESIFFTESGEDWEGILAVGVTWERLEDTVIEGGVGFGVSDAADDVNAFVTLVQRF